MPIAISSPYREQKIPYQASSILQRNLTVLHQTTQIPAGQLKVRRLMAARFSVPCFLLLKPLLPYAPHMISFVEAQPAGSTHDLVKQVEEIFSPTGILSRAKNFEFRPQQQQMAMAVARALENREHLAVEAGTGVGKSLAYLVPAILFAVQEKKKAVVSTHTINLQEQLTEKDLPMLAGVLGALPQPVKFQFTMLKGRANYLCTRRLQKAMQQSGNLFTSSEGEELRRIYEWSQTTKDGSLSDFEIEPDPKVWCQVCSERGLCSPKICGYQSDFSKDHPVCFFQRARNKILSSDVLVLNHTLFFTLLGGLSEEQEGGILFKNDFVIFDEAHTMESVASKHIGLSVSSGQMRYALNRLWNPRTEKGLLATLRQGASVKLVAELLSQSDEFFCERRNRLRRNSKNRETKKFRQRRTPARLDRTAHPPRGIGRRQRHAAPPAPARIRERPHQDERGQGHRPGTDGMQPPPRRVARRSGDVPQPNRGGLCVLGRTLRQIPTQPRPQRRARGRRRISPPPIIPKRHVRHHDQRHAFNDEFRRSAVRLPKSRNTQHATRNPAAAIPA